MMRRPSKLRRFLKWAGLVVCALVVAAWGWSAWRALSWDSQDIRHELLLNRGAIGYGWRPAGWSRNKELYPNVPGWSIAEYGGGGPMLLWWVEVSRLRSWHGVMIPLWIPFILVTIPTVVLWYQDRRCIPTAINRWARRLRPRQRKKVTFWSVVVFGVIHVAATVFAVVVLVQIIPFFFSPQSTVGELLDTAVSWGAPIFFFGTPLWAILWAWVYARFLNRLMRKLPAPYCPQCGYNLTGNTSGRCPECGQPISDEVAA